MPRTVFPACSIGLLARQVISRSGEALVRARFERSFYLDVDGSLITIGDRSLHDGPLNLRLTSAYEAGLTTVFENVVGEHWTVAPRSLRRADGLEIDMSKAETWRPDEPSAVTDRARLKKGLDGLFGLLDRQENLGDGLMRLVLGARSSPSATERAALPHIEALNGDLPSWLTKGSGDFRSAIQLLGLGPGLTPSGDDLLAGVLITWRHLGAASLSDRLGSCLFDAGVGRTTTISLAHLEAAAKGFGASPLHQLLDALIVNRHARVVEALDAAAKIGHSSGLDAIAGMVLALTAWLRVECETPLAA